MSTESRESTGGVATGASRRALFAGAGAVGTGALLAACGSDPGGGGGPPAPPDGTSGNVDTGPLAEASEVEVGSGVVNEDAGVVITQPTAGEFKGFSDVCTHDGCPLRTITQETGTIDCGCHGSKFSIEDGAVVQKARTLPADAVQDPLPEVAIREEDGKIFRA